MLSRRQVARKLGVSPASIARLDGTSLHPIRDSLGRVYYDDRQVDQLLRMTAMRPKREGYTPTRVERLADSDMRRDVAICIERGMSLVAILHKLDYDCEEIEKVYDELTATPEERHHRQLDKVRENGRAKELLEETRARLNAEIERIGRELIAGK